MAELFLTKRAKLDLKSAPKPVQRAVVETLEGIQREPQSAGKPLRGRLRGLWSCRVGNYRVLYTIEGSARRTGIIVRAIRHRGVAYRRPR